MSGVEQVLTAGPVQLNQPRRPLWRQHLRGSELRWAVAFVVPYAAVLLAFAVHPIVYALWMAGRPSLYAELFADPHYIEAAVNTALFAGFATNVMMFTALLLSNFFMRDRRWIKGLLVVCMLPWALPAIPAFVSFHWMLIGDYGFIDSALSTLFGIDGPNWFNDRWVAIGCNAVSYIWKWLPFWTLIFLAGQMAIPQDLREAAAIDGANAYRQFLHITVPLLTNLYLICTAIAMVWAIGEFSAIELVSGGAPARSSEVLATLSIRYAFDNSYPALGVAVALSALPVLIPIVVILMRRIDIREIEI
jgi:multiple sugar transport system permease protein